MNSTYSRILIVTLALGMIAAAGCSKKRNLNPETRIPGTGSGILADSSSSADGAHAGGPGAGWQPGGGPPAASTADSGLTSSTADSPFASGRGFGPEAGTGGFAQSANLSGVEGATQIADLDMVHFAYDDSTLTSDWQRVLDRHAEWLKNNRGVHVQIEGHCDERGTEEYNVSLGQRRADAVREHLVRRGVEDWRISTISYGKLRPLTFDAAEESHALNRRAMFLVYSPGQMTASAN